MKKCYFVLGIIMLLMFVLPNNVYANIICNDGTVSPSCTDCHRGCCSRHGGCTNNPNKTNSYKKKNSTSNKKTKNKIDSNNSVATKKIKTTKKIKKNSKTTKKTTNTTKHRTTNKNKLSAFVANSNNKDSSIWDVLTIIAIGVFIISLFKK